LCYVLIGHFYPHKMGIMPDWVSGAEIFYDRHLDAKSESIFALLVRGGLIMAESARSRWDWLVKVPQLLEDAKQKAENIVGNRGLEEG
ncbi:hypothetical protein ACFLZP_04590, partial [Patescibacteria group bacterium]